MISLPQFTGFDWDVGNRDKNVAHGASDEECEEVFLHLPLVMAADLKHSEQESRLWVLGQTAMGRRLFLIFTPRGSRIRIISARAMTKHERRIYDETEEETSA